MTAGAALRRSGGVLARGAWIAAAVVLALLLARVFVASVYRVEGSSMEPTLHGPDAAGRGGERVLVLHRFAPRPERYDLVVIRRPGSADLVVKRVAGLPGERVRVGDGDLFVGGARLPQDSPRPPLVPLFDQRTMPVEEHFHFQQAPAGPWTREGDAWRLDAGAIPATSDAGLMLLHKDLRDGWLDAQGQLAAGTHQVSDARLSCEVRAEQGSGELRLRLVEEGDTFQAVIALSGDGARATLQRTSAADPGRDLLQPMAELAWTAGWHRVALSNVDNRVELAIDGALVLRHDYAANTPYLGATPSGQKSVGARAALGGAGLVASFRAIEVERDLHWLPIGDHGVDQALPLGPSEYFLLGDNSAHSADSRLWGAVPASDVVGRPLAVIWPPSSWRWLRGTAAPVR